MPVSLQEEEDTEKDLMMDMGYSTSTAGHPAVMSDSDMDDDDDTFEVSFGLGTPPMASPQHHTAPPAPRYHRRKTPGRYTTGRLVLPESSKLLHFAHFDIDSGHWLRSPKRKLGDASGRNEDATKPKKLKMMLSTYIR